MTYETTFAYDALSNVTGVTDALGRATDLLHDDRGNLVETLSPDTGRTRFVYDASGNLIQKIENAPATGAGGRVTSYSYDGLDRLTSIDLPNDPDWTFSYDSDAAKNQKGRLAQGTNGSVTTQLEYTQRGDVAIERTIVDGVAYAVSYEYDAASNRTQIAAPSASRHSLSYTGLRPSTLAVMAGTRTELVTGIEWHPFGPRTRAMLPPMDPSGANVVRSTRDVNLRGQITRVLVERTDAAPALALLDRSYDYAYVAGVPGPTDAGPNLDRVTDALDPTESRFYFYDALDRLQKATDPSGASLHEYAYDAVGNRTSTLGPPGSTTYTYEPGSNRLDAASGSAARDFAHDVYGNRTYDSTVAYTGTASLVYDDANRLVEVKDPSNGFATLATYTYDAFGRRVKKVSGGKTLLFFYDTEGHLIEEVQKNAGAADLARYYVFLEDELVGLVDKQKEVGVAAWVPPGGGAIEIDPRLAVLLLFGLAGLGIGVTTRRWSPGLAASGSGVAVLLLCAGTQRPPQMTWVHVDPLGTPLAVTNSPATWNATTPTKTIWRGRYEPFGKATAEEDPDGDTATFSLSVRFPGQYEDAETGWDYNFYRTYDPSTGRYLEPDPAGIPALLAMNLGSRRAGPDRIDGKDSVALPESEASLYNYAALNPTGRIDPLGLSSLHTRLAVAIAQGNASALRTLIGTGALSSQQEARARAALERLGLTAEEILARECLGSVRGRFPSELLQETLEQIMRLARTSDSAARRALKLLNDNRFKK